MQPVSIQRTRVASNPCHPPAAAAINRDVSLGFVWMPQLADLLAQYEKQRDKYPNFNAFIPKVVEFFNDYVAKLPPASQKN